MRLSPTLVVAAGFLLAGTPVAMAQGVNSGLEVQVNPLAMRGGEMLLYPDGRGYRYVTPLLYPGQPANQLGGPVQLHPARKRPARPAAPRVAAAPKPAPAPAPAPLPAPDTRTFAGGMFNSPALTLTPQTPVTPPAQKPVVQATAPKPSPAQSPAQSPPTAKPAASGNANLTKRSVILFAKDATDPAEGALGALKFLAGDLNAAMTTAAARVELQAFGGARGDKGSDARRLSLKRALAIRQVLIDDGVSPDRIDVRAMGGSDDSGPTDRVDVYVRAS